MMLAATNTQKYTEQQITHIQAWTPKLFSFKINRPDGYRFAPGQWARLGVKNPSNDETVWRAYSIVSANYATELEFYSIVVPNGAFTSLLSSLKVGDTVLIEKTPYGFLTTDRFQSGKNLWLLSTGTGIAPFISILQDPYVWQHYDQLILVHGVRQSNELVFTDLIKDLTTQELFAEYTHQCPNKLTYIACVTQESNAHALPYRITEALNNGALERVANVSLDLADSRIMLCGNPEMVDQTRGILKERGFTVSRQTKPGQIAVENYW